MSTKKNTYQFVIMSNTIQIDLIDESMFSQLLDLDDNDNFVQNVYVDFFQQVDDAITHFEKLLKENKMQEINKLGHFLKGGAASTAANKIQNLCQQIQYHSSPECDKESIYILTNIFEQLKVAYTETKLDIDSRLVKHSDVAQP